MLIVREGIDARKAAKKERRRFSLLTRRRRDLKRTLRARSRRASRASPACISLVSRQKPPLPSPEHGPDYTLAIEKPNDNRTARSAQRGGQEEEGTSSLFLRQPHKKKGNRQKWVYPP